MLSLVKIDMVILEKIYKLPQRIFAISLLSALEKGHNSLFEQTWISFTQKVFVTSLLEIDPGVLEKIFEFRKYISCFLIISQNNNWEWLRWPKNFTFNFSALIFYGAGTTMLICIAD